MKDLTCAGTIKQLRALTFDLDDTLWDNRPVLMAAEQTLYDWLGQHYPRINARQSQTPSANVRAGLPPRAWPLRDSLTSVTSRAPTSPVHKKQK
jgi:FMN phosphatase YigB (HAD superfamily)